MSLTSSYRVNKPHPLLYIYPRRQLLTLSCETSFKLFQNVFYSPYNVDLPFRSILHLLTFPLSNYILLTTSFILLYSSRSHFSRLPSYQETLILPLNYPYYFFIPPYTLFLFFFFKSSSPSHFFSDIYNLLFNSNPVLFLPSHPFTLFHL